MNCVSSPQSLRAGKSHRCDPGGRRRRGSVLGALLHGLTFFAVVGGLCVLVIAPAVKGTFPPDAESVRADRLDPAAAECCDIRTLALSADGRFLATSRGAWQMHITVTETGSGMERRLPHQNSTPVSDLAFGSQSQLLAVAHEDGSVVLWDLQSPADAPLWTHEPDGPVVCVAISPNSRLVAESNGDGRVRLREARSGHVKRELRVGGVDSSLRLRFSPDSRAILSVGMDGSLGLWSTATGKNLQMFSRAAGGGGVAAEFSPDGSQLVSAGPRGLLRIWSVETGKQTAELDAGVQLTALAISPDARWLAAGATNGLIRVWHLESLQPEADLRGHTRTIRRLRFDADGRSLYSASWDATVRLWDVEAGTDLLLVD